MTTIITQEYVNWMERILNICTETNEWPLEVLLTKGHILTQSLKTDISMRLYREIARFMCELPMETQDVISKNIGKYCDQYKCSIESEDSFELLYNYGSYSDD